MAKNTLYDSLGKIVILGGTFDPIHNGHMQMAHLLLSIFKTKITFIPTGIPDYKAPPQASNEHRLNMLELALNGHPYFQIDTRETEAHVYSPTYQTLLGIRREINNQVPIYFLIGGDSLINLDSWDCWVELLGLTHFVVANRMGYSMNAIQSDELKAEFIKRKRNEFKDLNTRSAGYFYMLDFTPDDVSSTLIRCKVKNGEDISGYVSDSVASYIHQHHLYLD
jgi:nicotinate-nucleotide adenylyltransferase